MVLQINHSMHFLAQKIGMMACDICVQTHYRLSSWANRYYNALLASVVDTNYHSIVYYDLYACKKYVLENHTNVMWLHILWIVKFVMGGNIDEFLKRNFNHFLDKHHGNESLFSYDNNDFGVFEFGVGQTKILSRGTEFPNAHPEIYNFAKNKVILSAALVQTATTGKLPNHNHYIKHQFYPMKKDNLQKKFKNPKRFNNGQGQLNFVNAASLMTSFPGLHKPNINSSIATTTTSTTSTTSTTTMLTEFIQDRMCSFTVDNNFLCHEILQMAYLNDIFVKSRTLIATSNVIHILVDDMFDIRDLKFKEQDVVVI
jgi:hypothetical protein